jgi:hypothetical protein
MLEAVLVAIAVATAVLLLWIVRDSRRRQRALLESVGIALFRGQRAYWSSPPDWQPVGNLVKEAWHAETAKATHDELVAVGFRHLGRIAHRVPTTPPRILAVLSVFVDESGTVIAAAHAPDTVDVIQMETEFVDGRIVNTRNFPISNLSEPPDFSVDVLPLETAAAELLARHRDRVTAALSVTPSQPVVFEAVDDIIATQHRQWAKRREVRLQRGLVTRADVEHAAEWKTLSSRDRDRIYDAFVRERDRAEGSS